MLPTEDPRGQIHLFVLPPKKKLGVTLGSSKTYSLRPKIVFILEC
jgi:hypothetical protein